MTVRSHPPRPAAAIRRALAGMRPVLALLAAAALAFAPSAAAAQRLVRGTVVDSASRTAIAGAVVTVLDSAGAVRARTIAGADGAFAVPAAGAARLRVVRIGFRPRDLAVGAGDAPLAVAMLRIPQMLDVVRVAGEATCGGQAGAALDLWQQARDGLLAAIVARDARPADVRLLRVERTLSLEGDTVRTETARWTTGRSARPLRAAREPTEFASAGYASRDGNGRTFYAPDADVLFDESFAAAHCFRVVQADARHPGAIGLAFEPARDRRDVVDVRGTLWLDPAGPSLRELEFTFTNVEREYERVDAGGRIGFATAPNGVVLVSQWSVRLPLVGAVAERRASTVLRGDDLERRARARAVGLVGVSETGGAVASARWPDATVWEDSLGRLGGRVAREDGTPAAGALVSLVGTARTAAADADGRYAFAWLLPGTYAVAAADTVLAGWLAPRADTAAVAVTGAAVAVADLGLPVPPSPVAALCERMPAGTGLLLARITGAAGPQGVTVGASWLAGAAVQRPGPAATLVANEARYTIEPDDAGRFHLCGVALDRPLRLVAARDGLRVGDTTVVVRDVAPSVVALRTVARSARTATLAGAVRADDGARVANAEVVLPELGLASRTDSAGAFRFEKVPPGHLELVVRAIGFTPRADSVVVAANGTTTRDVSLARGVARLADVEVTGADTPVRLREFESRRALGIGHFLDESLLRANDTRVLSDLLAQRVPGLRMRKEGGAEYAVSARAATRGNGGALAGFAEQGKCYLDVFVDGTRVYIGGDPSGDPPDLARYGVRDYMGVEVYVGIGSVPARYARHENQCGVMLLWTRSR